MLDEHVLAEALDVLHHKRRAGVVPTYHRFLFISENFGELTGKRLGGASLAVPRLVWSVWRGRHHRSSVFGSHGRSNVTGSLFCVRRGARRPEAGFPEPIFEKKTLDFRQADFYLKTGALEISRGMGGVRCGAAPPLFFPRRRRACAGTHGPHGGTLNTRDLPLTRAEFSTEPTPSLPPSPLNRALLTCLLPPSALCLNVASARDAPRAPPAVCRAVGRSSAVSTPSPG